LLHSVHAPHSNDFSMFSRQIASQCLFFSTSTFTSVKNTIKKAVHSIDLKMKQF
jgi:hypothetical protein